MVEFYLDGVMIASVKSSMTPKAGEMVNIRGVYMRVEGANYVLDYADDPNEKRLNYAVCLIKD